MKQSIATLSSLFSLADHHYSGSLGYVYIIIVDTKNSAVSLSHLFKHPRFLGASDTAFQGEK